MRGGGGGGWGVGVEGGPGLLETSEQDESARAGTEEAILKGARVISC